MTRQRFFVTFALTFAVAGLPLSGLAQDRTSNGNTTGSAVPRGGDSGGGSAVPRGGDGGGSSSGSSSGGSSSGGDVGGGSPSGMGSSLPSSPTVPSPWSSFDAPRRSSDQSSRTRSGGDASTGTATPRNSGGSAPRSEGSNASGRSASSGSDGFAPARRAVPATAAHATVDPPRARSRTAAPWPHRTAAEAATSTTRSTRYYPWGFWGPGYGFGLGYLYYDPFYSGYGYGFGYPGGYGGYSGGGYGGGGGGYAVSQSYRDNGSLRLKIDPRQAQVYIDGYYVGLVDEYDGAFQKLGVEGGGHKVELKADGYEPLQFEVLITPGETVTYKGEMKRIK